MFYLDYICGKKYQVREQYLWW